MVLPGKGMGWKEFGQALKTKWAEDNVGDTAGNLTFAAVLALFPFLLFLVALAGLIIDPGQVQQLIGGLGKVAPGPVSQILGQRLQALVQNRSVGLLTVGAVGALWSASGGMAALMRALNTTYDVKEGRPFWKVRGVALLMTFFGAAAFLISALVAVAAPAVASHLPSPFGDLLLWLRLPLAGLAIMFVWAVLYYVLPDAEQDFKFITPGSVIGVLIWLLASWGFSVYVSHFGNYDATYGALGGVIVLLMWMWISAQVLLLGAEINAVLEHRSPEGKRAGAKSMRDTGVSPAAGKGGGRAGAEHEPGPEPQRQPPTTRPAPQHLHRSTKDRVVDYFSALGLGLLTRRFARGRHGS